MQQGQWTTGDLTISINGLPLRLKVSVPDYPVKPQVMLPVFQQLANTFTSIAEKVVDRKGEKISCTKGCGACCRQPVPLAEIEIYHIADVVERLPEPRRSVVKQRFHDAAWHFHNSGWYERFEYCTTEDELKALAFEYFAQGIPCPFLEEESCSIHQERPIICREYLVTSPAEHCKNPSRDDIARVELPASATHGTCRVAKSPNMKRKNFTFMVFALMWAEQHPESFAEKTGEQWLGEFFGSEENSDGTKSLNADAAML